MKHAALNISSSGFANNKIMQLHWNEVIQLSNQWQIIPTPNAHNKQTYVLLSFVANKKYKSINTLTWIGKWDLY